MMSSDPRITIKPSDVAPLLMFSSLSDIDATVLRLAELRSRLEVSVVAILIFSHEEAGFVAISMTEMCECFMPPYGGIADLIPVVFGRLLPFFFPR